MGFSVPANLFVVLFILCCYVLDVVIAKDMYTITSSQSIKDPETLRSKEEVNAWRIALVLRILTMRGLVVCLGVGIYWTCNNSQVEDLIYKSRRCHGVLRHSFPDKLKHHYLRASASRAMGTVRALHSDSQNVLPHFRLDITNRQPSTRVEETFPVDGTLQMRRSNPFPVFPEP
ncbi:G-type lectin S-receptor serine/threonine-protein kinase [Spatholobus suberectus]|nr:G-type lectin S-receptor serine/threonine-protein kinase [Spatholobus suberectus]